jgi:hypothetical protein
MSGFAVKSGTTIASASQTVLAGFARSTGQAVCTGSAFGANGSTLASRTSRAVRAHCARMT